MMGFVDTGVTPGSTYTYTIKVSDPFGNTLTPAEDQQRHGQDRHGPSPYAADVLNDGASDYWRLGEPSGTAVYDYGRVQRRHGPVRRDSRRGRRDHRRQRHRVRRSTDPAAAIAATNSTQDAPANLTVEAWIKTTTTQRRQDRRLRQRRHRQEQQLRPASVHGQRRTHHLRGLQQRHVHDHQPEDRTTTAAGTRSSAPSTRPAGMTPLHRRQEGRSQPGHDDRSALHRLLADRWRQPQRLAEPALEPLLQRLHR